MTIASFYRTMPLNNVMKVGSKEVFKKTTSSKTCMTFNIHLPIENTEYSYKKYVRDLKCDFNPFSLVKEEMNSFDINIFNFLSSQRWDESLNEIIRFVLSTEGKKVRPTLNVLMAKALNGNHIKDKCLLQNKNGMNLDFSNTFERQKRLSEITEMMHIASLLHDDVVDKSDMRRNNLSVCKKFGNKVAVLAGDFFLANASLSGALLGNDKVNYTISCYFNDLVEGEFMRTEVKEEFDLEVALDKYCLKNFLKTASLIANSCKAIAILNECDKETEEFCFEYGKNLGLCFQVIDDLLDISNEYKEIGKPRNNDFRQGVITAPFLFAAEKNSKIQKILRMKRIRQSDENYTMRMIEEENGLMKARKLAEYFAVNAIECALNLPDNVYRDGLIRMVDFVLNRNK